MGLINSYFDFDDYDSPVKSYIDDSVYTRTTAGYYKHTVIYLQKRSAERNDNYFTFWDDSTTNEFLGVNKILNDFETDSTNSKLVEFIFIVDPEEQIYSRSVYNVLTWSGDIGGVFGILEIVGAVLVEFLSGYLFK